VGVANDGQYAFHAHANGELGLSLARGAVHCRFGDAPARAEEHHTYLDQGQHDFRFRLLWGKAPAVAKALIPAAMELNLPLESFFMYHHPTPRTDAPGHVESPLQITPDTVVLAALKRADDGDDLVLRLNETVGRRTRASLRIAGMDAPATLTLRPFEVKTVRVSRSAGGLAVTPCSLLEEADDNK
jgi:alpha-mannosidase